MGGPVDYQGHCTVALVIEGLPKRLVLHSILGDKKRKDHEEVSGDTHVVMYACLVVCQGSCACVCWLICAVVCVSVCLRACVYLLAYLPVCVQLVNPSVRLRVCSYLSVSLASLLTSLPVYSL